MRLVSKPSLCAAVLVAQALTAETAVSQSTPTERGQAIAEKQCARCHAVGLTGTSPMGLAPPFRDLSQRYPIETLAEALAEGIVTGHPAMPHFTFHPREIDALLTYIESLTPLREPRVPKR
jgi:cytochrome c